MPETATLFPDFREHRSGPIFARVGGSGPPLLLLHGFPQTGAMWHKISAGLAEHFTRSSSPTYSATEPARACPATAAARPTRSARWRATWSS